MSASNGNNKSIDLFGEHMENYNIETSALHRKLQSKIDALNILRRELETFRTERDQFKLMAETLQLRYKAIKTSADYNNFGFGGKSSVAILLNETREKNISLNTEVEALKQKLDELQGDLNILRTQMRERQNHIQHNRRNNISIDSNNDKDNVFKTERNNFINELENLKKRNAQLSFDLKVIIDEKHELVMERDAYKCKAHRLNHELLVALKTNESHPKILDVDGLLLENKLLQDRLENSESELEFYKQSASKYKTILDSKRKKGILKLGTTNENNLMSHKQVRKILDEGGDLPTKMETITDLKALCLALLDSLNDKNLVISHQKKTNKILAAKIVDLEKRLALDDCAGTSSGKSFSPTDILLGGYSPVDIDNVPNSPNVTEDSGTMSSDTNDSNKTSRISIDCIDSISSESGQSMISSEYGNSGNDLDEVFKYKSSVGHLTPDLIAKERLDDLKDLPPELSEMVQKALIELDMKEFESTENLRKKEN